MLTSYGMPVGTTPTVHNTALLPTPTRDGYIFEGWYTGNNETITAGMNCYWINDLTVYAHWKEIGKATVTVNHYNLNMFLMYRMFMQQIILDDIRSLGYWRRNTRMM